MLRIGETIDRYKVEALIGQGGMAAVFRARHMSLDSEHAIKVLFITAPQIRDRLLREGKVQANLRHPNVVAVTDVLEIQGAPALVMEYIDGPALDSWLQNNKPTIDEAMWLFRGILRGVMAAHERGVVHRDLKPANIMLSRTNEGIVPKVTDFGLVKSVSDQKGHTQTGMALGTPEYMAPEQIRDASDVDQRADLFALGCILYELVCGKRAFGHPDKMTTFNAIVAGEYEPARLHVPDIPQEIAEAIRWCLEVDREKRLPNCTELFDLLYEDTSVGRLGPPSQAPSMLRIEVDEDSAANFGSSPNASPGRGPGKDPVLAAAPTGKPAAERSRAPTQLQDTARAKLPAPSRQGERGLDMRLVAMASLFVMFVGVGSGILVAGLLGDPAAEEDGLTETNTDAAPAPEPDPAPTAPEPAPVDPAPVQPDPVSPDPEAPKPVPPPPKPVTTAPDPRPAAPEPRPTAPVPSPVAAPEPPPPTPVPVPDPVPAPTASGVSVSVKGDAKGVWLVSGGNQTPAAGSHPPGSYQIVADFGGKQVPAGKVDLAAGRAVTLDCSSFLFKCLAK